MEAVQKFLSNIGLNHYASKIYLYLLAHGEQAASKVATATQIPRSTTRGILDQLCQKGIVSKLYKQNTQYYRCKEPAALKALLQGQIADINKSLSQLEDLTPTLQGLYENRKVLPKVQYFEGTEQVIEAFNKSLFADIDEILIFTSYQFLQNPLIRQNDDEFFIKTRIEKGIKARVLVGKNEESSKMIKQAPAELRERRFIPEKYVLPGNIHIYGNSVMQYTASNDEYIAVLTESQMMADTMRALFEFMWENVDQ